MLLNNIPIPLPLLAVDQIGKCWDFIRFTGDNRLDIN